MIDRFLNQLERRFGSWAIPGLMRYMAILYAGVYLLSAFFPYLGQMMDFDLEKIRNGELWRILTFVFAPSATSDFSAIGLLFSFFAMMLTFLFSDSLEQQWGIFRANLYAVVGYVITVLAALVLGFAFGYQPILPGIYLGMSVMFAFATYHPQFKLMIMFIIPVSIWVIASILGVMTMLGVLAGFVFGDVSGSVFTLLALSNYIALALSLRFSPERLQLAEFRRANQSRMKLSKAKTSASASASAAAFHQCKTCGATDVTHPEYVFRVGADGEDYCTDHLPDD
ncbi:MAG: hypothetical protein ACSHX0_06600 [Akkermansiaceae bacterium]